MSGPSQTHGAARRSWRNVATQGKVCQCPWGRCARNRWPWGQRPWRRIRCVLAQGSARKTRRRGRHRRCAMSGRSCSEATRLFFKAEPFTFEEAGQHARVDLYAPLPHQPGRQRGQREGGLGRQHRSHPRAGRLPLRGSMPPGARALSRPAPLEALQPFERDRRTEPKPPRRCPPAQSFIGYGVHHAVSQILRVGAGHLLPPSSTPTGPHLPACEKPAAGSIYSQNALEPGAKADVNVIDYNNLSVSHPEMIYDSSRRYAAFNANRERV